MINENFSAILYLISSVFFILALKGLSSPETARRGNIFGILGMLTAISTLIIQPNTSNFIPVVICILLGGAFGTTLGLKIKMTAMPQLVAGFHSLVGLAAVLFRVPIYLHEQNTVLGTANKILLRFAKKCFLGLPLIDTPKNDHFELTGNPIRKILPEPGQEYDIASIYITGGSQGANFFQIELF